MAKKKRGGHGGHGWFVTFADLMALLMSFFVMVAAYSSQNKEKMQVIAGSFREAFGSNKDNRFAGIIEQNGIPTRPHLLNSKLRPIEEASDFTAPNDFKRRTEGTRVATSDRGFALATTSLRQALNDMPEIAQVSKNIIIEETKDGLNLSLVDQDGRSMFADGSVNPLERTRMVLESVVPTLLRLPNRIAISGHTSGPRPGQRLTGGGWELSVGRAAAVREILANAGVPDGRFASVTGKADTEPMFPDNADLAANRRVTITLLYESAPLPLGLKP
ncbi:MAG: flagellar motor protein MotB [Hyphomicrobiales bacterium]|jgi:chemotaxis protein MotB|nr:flagellar motor protein MotB [Hyphomicrobiales bacterium]